METGPTGWLLFGGAAAEFSYFLGPRFGLFVQLSGGINWFFAGTRAVE